MFVTGYFGEAGIIGMDAQLWGLVSGLAYFAIVHEIFMGSTLTAKSQVEMLRVHIS